MLSAAPLTVCYHTLDLSLKLGNINNSKLHTCNIFLCFSEVLHKTKVVGPEPLITKIYTFNPTTCHPSKFLPKIKTVTVLCYGNSSNQWTMNSRIAFVFRPWLWHETSFSVGNSCSLCFSHFQYLLCLLKSRKYLEFKPRKYFNTTQN